MNYFWIRVYEYNYERDSCEKGILLDEFYLKGEGLTRNEAKEQVKEKYTGQAKDNIKFAKPRKKDGLYVVVMDSDKFFYDRFYLQINTHCFHCHKPIKGKASEFPKINLSDNHEIDLESKEDTAYFCSYDCKRKLYSDLRFEGEFQEKETLSASIFGYIYHMYNRVENKHYVGQTKYLPFFRWQEHIKDGAKGDITDITFSVLTEVRRINYSDDESQKLLNSVEAWWIQKYIEEGYEVFNVTIPKLSLSDYKKNFDEMVIREKQLSLTYQAI